MRSILGSVVARPTLVSFSAHLTRRRSRMRMRARLTAEHNLRLPPRLPRRPLLHPWQCKHPHGAVLSRDTHPPGVERVDAKLDDGAPDGDARGVHGEAPRARQRVEGDAAAWAGERVEEVRGGGLCAQETRAWRAGWGGRARRADRQRGPPREKRAGKGRETGRDETRRTLSSATSALIVADRSCTS